MKNLKFLNFKLLLVMNSLILFALPTYAQINAENLMINLVAPTPIIKADLIALIFKIIQYLLSFLGVIAISILAYGGFLWMTARGNEEQVKKAKKVIINGLIGLIVVLLSYAIVSFVMKKPQEFTGPPQACSPGVCCAPCYRCDINNTCSVYDRDCLPCSPPSGEPFVVKWTYPDNGDENISLCALLQASFSADLDENSVNSNTVKITIRDGKNEGEPCRENKECKSQKCEGGFCVGETVAGTFIVVKNVFKFNNEIDFEKETWYRFLITTGVRSKDGRYLAAQRTIDFKTGTEEDTTPPQVGQTYPERDQENVCLLDPIQVVFSEPMDVTTLLDEQNSSTDPSHQFNRSVPNVKTFNLSPTIAYRQFETYQVTLRADLSDGIADVCGNKLDGDGDGTAEGSPTDDYVWSFTTGDTLYCDPVIENITPSLGYYEDQLTISGNYFKLAGDLIFNYFVYVNHLCFDDNNFPQEPCLISWRNREIKVKVPATGGSSEGAISGPVYVKIGGRQSNSKNFNLLSPYISSFTPNSGGRGQAITIKGERFGLVGGEVYFIEENTHQRTPANLICGSIGWKDYEIVVAVPENLTNGNYYLQVKTISGKYSNIRSQTFEVNNNPPGPVLCDITPYCPGTNLIGGKKDEEKTLSGNNFGPERGRVIFDSTEAEIISWDDEEIKIKVPDLPTGTYQVKVQDSNFKDSNPLSFISPCLPKGGFGSACFLDQNTCTTEMCLSPYECLGNGPPLECRCCCTPTSGCLGDLQCDPTQVCYRNRLTGVEVYGVCCGCDENGQPRNEKCQENEICKRKNNGPFCCYSCEIGDEGKPCKGGECCRKDCSEFINQNECQRYETCFWNGNSCQGEYAICCHGHCVRDPLTNKYECKGLCGNGRIDPNEVCDPGAPNEICRRFNNQSECENYKGCEWTDNSCQPKVDLGGKTCQDLGYESGDLSCTANCQFDESGCQGQPPSGRLGDVCQNRDLNCYFGKKDCVLAPGTSCVRNNSEAPCACCCRPDDPNTPENEDSCLELDLVCDPTKKCSSTQPPQLGICCGCGTNDDKCCKEPPCIGTACYDNCCVRFGPPTNLNIPDPSIEKIKLKWQFSDPENLATEFEIWRKAPGENKYSCYASCKIENSQPTDKCFNLTTQPNGKFCDQGEQNDNFSLTLEGNTYTFVDQTGGFSKEPYYFKVRAKKGISTAYTEFTPPASGTPRGVISCQKNEDCPDGFPCCRIDTKVCVDWQNCNGQCREDEKCHPPEGKFALADFWITEDKMGPCLVKVNPNQGYPCEPDLEKTPPITSVIFTGFNFGLKGPNDGVFFNGKKGSEFEDIKEACQGCENAQCRYRLWEDGKVEVERTPPDLAETGLVKVKKVTDLGEVLWSNGKTFTVLKRTGGAGTACRKTIAGCPVGVICQPAEIYSCLECDCSQFDESNCKNNSPYCQWEGRTCKNIICEEINNETVCQKYSHCLWLKAKNQCLTQSSHCRCCCDPGLRGPDDPCKILNSRLECYPNQSPCTGQNRGLCCGCEKDSDCNLVGSNNNGCAILETAPKCCYPRPRWISTSFCDEIGPNDVRLNTSITLNFDQKMDFNSLNKDNLKISRDGNCASVQEGESIQGRCYLYGDIVNTNIGERTQTIFRPKLCRLKTNTIYRIEIVVGEDGQEVRSEKGVSMNQTEGECSWDRTKNCQFEEFITAADENTLCEIEWIDVQPRLQIARDTNIAFNYYGHARDKKNNDVCVESFNWKSDNEKVATVSPHPDDPKIGVATSKGPGIAKIIASLPAINKTCDTKEHTCGLLKVSLAGPQVIEQKSCDVCELGGQSPSPWKFSDDACLKAQIVARFNRVMDPKSLNLRNILIHECEGNLNEPDQCPPEETPSLSGQLILIPDSTQPTGFRFKPSNNLNPNKVYRVILKSGKNGIKDRNSLELDGNKNGIEDGSPVDDYVWYFKTSLENNCPLNKVCLRPSSAKIVHPGRQDFSTEIYTQNCNYLEPTDYNWQWKSTDENVVKITSIGPNATAISVGLGITKIEAEAIGTSKKDTANLIVATVPDISEKYPTGSGLCRNTAIYATFDQKMNRESFRNNFKIEIKPASSPGHPPEPGQPLGQIRDVTSQFSLRFEELRNQTRVYFIPNNPLEPKATYRITLLPGIKSISPYDQEMGRQESWEFTTAPYICQLEKIKIKPDYHLFRKAKENIVLKAKPMYQEMEIEEIPGQYEWKWEWRSTDPAIATVTNSDNPIQTVESQPRNGLVSIIAKAEITKDEIFKPSTVGQFKEGASRIEVWLCENPWPCTNFPDCTPYEDREETKTNFGFRYCRDAGPAGIVGDLPIAKGGKISGPPETNKLREDFFTFYEGSLSLLYDGEITSKGTTPPHILNKSGYNNSNYTIFGDNNGIISGNITSIKGKFGNALSFDGNSSLTVNYLIPPDNHRNLTIESENFTLEAWVFLKRASSNSQYIFKKSDQTSGYGLEIKGETVYFWLFDQEGNKKEISAGPISQNDWTHLAASYDGKNLKLYLNGVLKAEGSSLKGGISHANSNLLIGFNFNGLLDEVAFWHKTLEEKEIESHLKNPISPTIPDAFGLKVFSNFEHLTSEQWYGKYAPGKKAAGSALKVDNYKAYRVGNTIYVTATNVLSEKVYTNLYLISLSDNPRPETSQVFQDIVKNWRFNINVDDPKPTTPANENKEKLVRDLERIWHLMTIWETLEKYRENNQKEAGFYPKLESGTYIIGMSTSVWPSWTSQTGLGKDLVEAGLSTLPNDPINKLSVRDNCGIPPTQYSCCANCPRKDPTCTGTCYNPETKKFEGINPCYVYQYMVGGRPLGRAYDLYSTFEFTNPDNWQHSCERLEESKCRSRAFCFWEKAPQVYNQDFIIAINGQVPGQCKTRTLNYSGNPCEKLGMNCNCFNTRFSNQYIPPPPPPPPPQQYTLNVYFTGTGSGSVTINPPGISCGSNCQQSYQEGTQVTLTAIPNASSTFAGWSGACSGTQPTCNLTMDGNKSVTATFNRPLYSLSVSLTGNGSGTVTSNPPGINCGSDCQESYPAGTQVILTASANAGSTFAGWSGACSGTGNCQLTMASDKSVTATFNLSVSPPTVSTQSASSITGTSATLNGRIENTNGQNADLRGFEWGTSSGNYPNSWTEGISGNYQYGVGSFNRTITGLTPNTTYYFRAKAHNSAGWSYGNEMSFTTSGNPPTVSTQAATYITSNEAVLNAQANPKGSNTIGWFRYSTTNPGSCDDNFGTRVPAQGGIPLGSGTSYVPYSQVVISLSPGTTYYFCAIAQNSGGRSYGNVFQFTTYPYYGFAYIANKDDHNVLMMNISNAQLTGSISLPNGSSDDPQAACITPDKRYVFITDIHSNHDNIFKIDTSTNQIIQSKSVGPSPETCAVTLDGQYLLVGYPDGEGAVVKDRVSDLSYVCSWTSDSNGNHFHRPIDVALSPDGQYAYFALESDLNPWDLAIIKIDDCSSEGLYLYNLSDYGFPVPKGIALSRDGRYLYLTHQEKIGIFEISGNNLTYKRTVNISDVCDYPQRAIAVSPDNQYLFVGCPGYNSKNVCRYTISGDDLIDSSCYGSTINARYDLAVTPDNQYVIVSSSNENKIYRCDINLSSCSSVSGSSVDNPRGVCIK